MADLIYSITAKMFLTPGKDGGALPFATKCWAGRGKHKDKPESCHVKNYGPLPIGRYVIKKAINHPRLGRVAIQLIPYADNVMHGRSDFWIHGASLNPLRHGQESMGCIIASKVDRLRLDAEGFTVLEVIA